MLPPAVLDFLDLSSDPDLNGYQADTSINTNDSNNSTHSSTPIMTLSGDFLLDPTNWTSDHLRVRLVTLRSLQPDRATPTTPAHPLLKDDPSSVAEPESEPEIATPTITAPPLLKDDPSSMTEPESEPETLPQSKFSTPIKIIPKMKSFFDTPSPPGPDSLY
ncbi:hypothetical protein DFH29DRAFT_1003129 [Suillus ampliporus]|nr:hypothetical protein DFH29DRAFT_1003129 [Suillus ampliporus]